MQSSEWTHFGLKSLQVSQLTNTTNDEALRDAGKIVTSILHIDRRN